MKKIWSFLMLMIVALVVPSCVRVSNVCGNSAGTNCDSVISDLQIDNPRFEFPSPQSNLRADNYWLRAGDDLNAAWDSYIVYLATPGTMCNGTTPVNVPSCQKCDFTNFRSSDCPSSFTAPPGVDLLQVGSFAGFSLTSTPAVIGHIFSGVANKVFSFAPAENATLKLTTEVAVRGDLAQSKAFVLTDGMTQPVTYQLQPLAQNVSDVAFYSGTVPRTPNLQDNYSTNLRIGRVRILKGKPDNDPVRGLFRLKDVSVVRPSRIVLIPDYRGDSVFMHDTTRCYSDPISADGDLDFTRCRYAAGSTNSALQDATPSYLKSAPQSTLSWVAEFRASEGGVAPVLGIDEVLAIEFTIQP